MGKRATLSDYRNMEWKTQTGVMPVSYMETNHIRNTIKTIKNGNGHSFNGYSSQDWLIALKKELQYRDRIADSIIALFPKLKASWDPILNSNKPYDHNTHTHKQNKLITTKGITRF